MTHISERWAKVRQVEFKSCSVVLDKEEDPNFITTCPFPSMAFLCKIFVLWIWELYSHSLLLAFKSLGCSVTSHGRAGKCLMPQHQLIAKILAKRNKMKEDSGCLCRDSVLSLPVDLKMKFEFPQAW